MELILDRTSIKVWKPDIPNRLSERLLRSAQEFTEIAMWDSTQIEVPSIDGVEMVSCVECLPHVDTTFPEWSLLYVARNAGHILHTGRTKYAVQNGDMILLNVHKKHYVSLNGSIPKKIMDVDYLYSKNNYFMAACTNYHDFPKPEEATNDFIRMLEKNYRKFK